MGKIFCTKTNRKINVGDKVKFVELVGIGFKTCEGIIKENDNGLYVDGSYNNNGETIEFKWKLIEYSNIEII